MDKTIYTVRELLLNETSTKNEFKPKLGDGVKSSNEKNNGKATKDIVKAAEDFDNDGRKKDRQRRPEAVNTDCNKLTTDVNFEMPASDEYKDRVKAQILGYPSVQNMNKNDYDKSLDFDGNKRIYDQMKDRSQQLSKARTIERESGLKAKEKAQKGVNYGENTMFENKKPTKRLVFKNTTFLSEAQVLQRVPEEYKIDENRFYMRDKTGTDYLVECQADTFGYIHMQITEKINKSKITEAFDKMRRLADYKYGDDNVKVDKTKLEDMSESIHALRELLK